MAFPDRRTTSNDESGGGDAAAALLFGDDEDAPVIAQALGVAASTAEFLDRYRLPGKALAESGRTFWRAGLSHAGKRRH